MAPPRRRWGGVVGGRACGLGWEGEGWVVRRLRGWSSSSAIRVDSPTPRSGALRLVTYAAAGACGIALAAGAAMSPLLRVRAVSWTGPIRLTEAAYTPFETAVLGQPLLLLSEARVRRLLSIDNHVLETHLHRHLPATLEVRLEPRRSLARLADGDAVDAHGRRLAAAHALPGLPLLVGFEWNAKGDRLSRESQSVLRSRRCEL